MALKIPVASLPQQEFPVAECQVPYHQSYFFRFVVNYFQESKIILFTSQDSTFRLSLSEWKFEVWYYSDEQILVSLNLSVLIWCCLNID